MWDGLWDRPKGKRTINYTDFEDFLRMNTSRFLQDFFKSSLAFLLNIFISLFAKNSGWYPFNLLWLWWVEFC